MSELDDFLNEDRSEGQARAGERGRREQEERERANSFRGQGATRPSGPPAVVLEAYKTLGLQPGTPPLQAKAAYKKLLMRYHPDRNSASMAEQKRATEISARINDAWQVIETWTTTGTVSA